MLEIPHYRRALCAAILGLAVLVSACERSDSTSDAEKQAALDNVDAMSREHAEDSSDASPAAEVPPGLPVDFDTLPYADVDNELAYGYLAFPSGVIEPIPAIIMIHEWWGLNDNVRAMANRLAAEGYMVLAVDLYGGSVAETPGQARQLMLEVVENPAPAEENLRQALDFLGIAGSPRIASLGWCFGGGWSLNSAMLFPEQIDASVIFYGQVTDDEERLASIEAPVLGLFAAEDTGIKVEGVNDFGDAMQRLRKDLDLHIYPGVGHAFANPTGNNYDAEAAEDAWQKTVDFLAQHLMDGQ
jgi:carboxymethylenebutenolidase